MSVRIYDHDMLVDVVILPNGPINTKWIKSNWSNIVGSALLELMLPCFDYRDLNFKSESDYIKWLKDSTHWKRIYKGKVDPDESWDTTYPDGSIRRMFITDEFEDGMDLNFITSPKDTDLLSIHFHSD